MIDISKLSHEEALALLKKIDDIVGDLPSFIERNKDGGYGRVYARYSCCRGNANQSHGKNCSIGSSEICESVTVSDTKPTMSCKS